MRKKTSMTAAAFASILITAAVAGSAQGMELLGKRLEAVGPATVIDGNHLQLKGTTMRLWGLEAPTDAWCTKKVRKGCSARAAEYLAERVGTNRIWCVQTREMVNLELETSEGTPVAMCQVIEKGKAPAHRGAASKRWLNWQMVHAGWAAAYDWQAEGSPLGAAMTKDGNAARRAKRGMWRYKVVIPDHASVRKLNPMWIPEGGVTLRGKANVITGDRLEIGGRTVQLAGITAAAEGWCRTDRKSQTCAKRAKAALYGMTKGRRTVSCAPIKSTTDSEGKEVIQAFCTTKRARTGPCDQKECWLNWKMVNKGHAIAARELGYQDPWAPFLVEAEQKAIKNEEGMWRRDVRITAISETNPERNPQPGGERIEIRGEAKVVAGDTIRIGPEELILFGMLSPREPWCSSTKTRNCQNRSRDALKALTENKTLSCSWIKEVALYFNDGRPRATCTVEGLQGGCEGYECTLNWQMVRSGQAVAYIDKYWAAGDRRSYLLMQADKSAKKEKTGIWAGKVKVPGWLKGHR